jgi:capsid protein
MSEEPDVEQRITALEARCEWLETMNRELLSLNNEINGTIDKLIDKVTGPRGAGSRHLRLVK